MVRFLRVFFFSKMVGNIIKVTLTRSLDLHFHYPEKNLIQTDRHWTTRQMPAREKLENIANNVYSVFIEDRAKTRGTLKGGNTNTRLAFDRN